MCIRDRDNLIICLEYIAGGSIASLLQKFGPFNENITKVYTKQILEGLEYLHANGVVHRDIKGANVLVDNSSVCKLADFGCAKKLSKMVEDEQRSLSGTVYWMAPEVIQQKGHGRSADIWSLGCTVFEMLTGKPPWSEYSNQITAMYQIAKSESMPKLPDNLKSQTVDFLRGCFQRNPKDRPNVYKCLRHPFITSATNLNDLPELSKGKKSESRSERHFSLVETKSNYSEKSDRVSIKEESHSLREGDRRSTAGAILPPLMVGPEERKESAESQPQDNKLANIKLTSFSKKRLSKKNLKPQQQDSDPMQDFEEEPRNINEIMENLTSKRTKTIRNEFEFDNIDPKETNNQDNGIMSGNIKSDAEVFLLSGANPQ
eukprot:TRINITY_DN14363_c0_g1_i4.p1 TRINITY_DN14363_c0_g1~~TRINITY_DN14363_c0_g1_i4.p1  ORF type:complete len:374 (+),score=68.41 TRINITY_DN14363_c0_g1_i4:64-1185(+)